jgi:hypothetical protein
MSENFIYYGKHKHKNYLVIRNDVTQNKTLNVRMDAELYSEIENLAKELNQTVSKVTKDILEDFFLDQKIKCQEDEISDII